MLDKNLFLQLNMILLWTSVPKWVQVWIKGRPKQKTIVYHLFGLRWITIHRNLWSLIAECFKIYLKSLSLSRKFKAIHLLAVDMARQGKRPILSTILVYIRLNLVRTHLPERTVSSVQAQIVIRQGKTLLITTSLRRHWQTSSNLPILLSRKVCKV